MDYLITNRSISPEVTKKFKLITKDDCLSILRQSSEVEYDSETSGLDPHLNDILLYQFGINDGKDSFVIDAIESISSARASDINLVLEDSELLSMPRLELMFSMILNERIFLLILSIDIDYSVYCIKY